MTGPRFRDIELTWTTERLKLFAAFGDPQDVRIVFAFDN